MQSIGRRIRLEKLHRAVRIEIATKKETKTKEQAYRKA
jgi:hypothetical protein